MSSGPRIDGFEFARAARSLSGTLPFAMLPRLAGLLADEEGANGALGYSIEGVPDVHGRPALRLCGTTTLTLRCVCCLEPMPQPVAFESLLVLAAAQSEIDAEPIDVDAPDRILAGPDMALAVLFEDEMLLAVPYAPRHEACGGAAVIGQGGGASTFGSLRELLAKSAGDAGSR